MKLWMRILLGSAVGVVLGGYIPIAGGDSVDILSMIARIVISIGRYGIYPVMFFGVAIAVYELTADRMTTRVFGKTVLTIVMATFGMIVIGTLIVLLLAPRRIPPIFQESAIPVLPDFESLMLMVFPTNFFSIFAQSGSYLLPVTAAGILIGLILHREAAAVVPLTDTLDSATRVFYRLNSWLSEALAIGMISVSAIFIMRLRAVNDLGLFAPLLLVVSAIAAFLVFVVFPGAVYLLCDRYNPFAWLYGLVSPGITAFFAGDSYFALGPLVRISKENYGISRSVSSTALALSTVFGKAGSAMVVAASFLTVLRSYTALGITGGQVLVVIGLSFAVSFLLGSVPGSTVLVGLSVLASVFGNGIDEIYLILLPALPVLTGVAVFTDTATAAFVSFLIAHRERKRRIVDVLDFV